MNFSKMKLALAAVALGTGALSAQEMGAAPAAPAPAAPVVPAAPAPAAPVVPAAPMPVLAAPADNGPAIVAKNQEFAPTVKAPTDAKSAVVKALSARGFDQNYQPERGSLIKIGYAEDVMEDPASPDFMIIRELLVRQAELDAKMKIAQTVRQQMKGSTRVKTLGTKERDDFMAKFADQIAAIGQQKAKVAELLQMLEQEESRKLANVSVDDQWVKLMDAIIKRLDAKYNKEDIAVEKQQQYLKVKAAYEQAKTQLDEMTKKQDDLYPCKTVETEAESYAEMKLCGAVDLVQAECWNGKVFSVAVAVVWSPTLQERALLTLGCGAPVGGKAGSKSLAAWLQEQEDNGELARLVGTKQYIDDKGRQYVLGFSAVELPSGAVNSEGARDQADLLAQQAVGFYLFSQGEGSTRVKLQLAKHNFKPGEAAKSGAGEMYQEMPKTLSISGLGTVYSATCRHEISGKDIYVSVAAVDSVLAGKSSEILRGWYAGAAKAVAMSQYLGAEVQGMSQAYQEVVNSNVSAQSGVEAGRQAVLDALKPPVPPTPAPAAPAVVAPVVQPPAVSKPKPAVIIGGQKFTDDF